MISSAGPNYSGASLARFYEALGILDDEVADMLEGVKSTTILQDIIINNMCWLEAAGMEKSALTQGLVLTCATVASVEEDTETPLSWVNRSIQELAVRIVNSLGTVFKRCGVKKLVIQEPDGSRSLVDNCDDIEILVIYMLPVFLPKFKEHLRSYLGLGEQRDTISHAGASLTSAILAAHQMYWCIKQVTKITGDFFIGSCLQTASDVTALAKALRHCLPKEDSWLCGISCEMVIVLNAECCPDSVAYCSVIEALAKSSKGKLIKMLEVYKEMQSLKIVLNIIVYNSMINILNAAGRSEQMQELFKDMFGHGLKPTPVTLSLVFRACAKTRKYEEANELYTQIKSEEWIVDAIVYNSMLSLCAHTGRIEEGKAISDLMGSKVCKPDDWTWKILINLYAKGGKFEEGRCIAKEMADDGQPVFTSVYISLIQAYAKAKDFKSVVELFAKLKAGNVPIDHMLAGALLSALVHCEGRRACILWNRQREPPEFLELTADDGIEILVEVNFSAFLDSCFLCRQSGHFARACPLADNRRRGANMETMEVKQANLASVDANEVGKSNAKSQVENTTESAQAQTLGMQDHTLEKTGKEGKGKGKEIPDFFQKSQPSESTSLPSSVRQ